MKLADFVAIVTGGASGIGMAIAHKYLSEGARVVIADWSHEALQAARSGFSLFEGQIAYEQVDISCQADVMAMVTRVIARFEAVHILVNCAAVSRFGPIEELDMEWWHKVININLNGTFYCCHAVAPHMIAQQQGCIINYGSLAALTGIPNQAPYVASKHAVVGLTKALAIDLGKFNIRVNCICPATTLTPMAVQTRSQEFLDHEAKTIPLGRLGTPEDHANAALFLASQDAAYLSGVIMPIDGGRYIALRNRDL